MRGISAVSETKSEPSEAGKAAADGDPSLGAHLTTLRGRLGLTREQVVSETHIPLHYLGMMESRDYSLISDQLYLVPFLRRYATFLKIDPEETAMRFVREVQRADSTPVPGRMSEPIEIDSGRKKKRSWLWIVILAAIIVLVGFVYMVTSERRANPTGPGIPAAPGVGGAPASSTLQPRQAPVSAAGAPPASGAAATIHPKAATGPASSDAPASAPASDSSSRNPAPQE